MNHLTIEDAAQKLATRDIRSIDLTRACLDAIGARNKDLNAFITVLGNRALADAAQADKEIAEGRYRGPLHGIPISLKDLIDLEGTPTTAASRVLSANIANADAPVAAALRKAGAVIVGKCNLHEFAFGTTSEDSAYGPVRNPHDPARTPGGSSGGSAAAVVAGMSLASIGTDTGGSIRIPSGACGLVGLKPGAGEVSCDRVVPLSWSLDSVGPLTRSVTDAWIVHEALRGGSTNGQQLEAQPLRGVRLGALGGYFVELLEDGVRKRFSEAVEALREGGADIVEIDVPDAPLIPAMYLHIVLGDAAAYHAHWLDSVFDQYTRPVALRISMGRYVLAEDYVRAQRAREHLRRRVDDCFQRCDALILPTLPVVAPRIGATHVQFGSKQEPVRNAMLRLTQPFNLSGHPAISLPCGSAAPPGADNPMPVGFQIVGRRGGTLDLLRLAKSIEDVI